MPAVMLLTLIALIVSATGLNTKILPGFHPCCAQYKNSFTDKFQSRSWLRLGSKSLKVNPCAMR